MAVEPVLPQAPVLLGLVAPVVVPGGRIVEGGGADAAGGVAEAVGDVVGRPVVLLRVKSPLDLDIGHMLRRDPLPDPAVEVCKGRVEEVGIGVVVHFPFDAAVRLPPLRREVGVVFIPVVEVVLLVVGGAGDLVAAEEVARRVGIPRPIGHRVFALGVQRDEGDVRAENPPPADVKDLAPGIGGVGVDRGQLGAAAGV